MDESSQQRWRAGGHPRPRRGARGSHGRSRTAGRMANRRHGPRRRRGRTHWKLRAHRHRAGHRPNPHRPGRARWPRNCYQVCTGARQRVILRPVTRWLLTLLLLGVLACGSPNPLNNVVAAPPSVSPELRDQRNRLDVRYHLSSPAAVSTRIESPDGQQWLVHDRITRPAAGDYVFQFDGSVSGPGPNERRVLANGDYRIVVEASTDGQSQRAEVPLTIRDADTTLP